MKRLALGALVSVVKSERVRSRQLTEDHRRAVIDADLTRVTTHAESNLLAILKFTGRSSNEELNEVILFLQVPLSIRMPIGDPIFVVIIDIRHTDDTREHRNINPFISLARLNQDVR
jgi:hypothetical protein